MEDSEYTLAIKLPVMKLPAKVIMRLKKLTGLSPTEIKTRVASDDYLLVFDYNDFDGLKLLNRIRREMRAYGIDVRHFEDGKEEPSELFDNLEQTMREIALEVALFTELELSEDEDLSEEDF